MEWIADFACFAAVVMSPPSAAMLPKCSPQNPASLPLVYSSIAAPQLDGLERLASCGERLVSHSLLRRAGAPIFSKIPEALKQRAGDQRQRHRGVIKNFGEAPALFGRNEFAPGDGFSVRA